MSSSPVDGLLDVAKQLEQRQDVVAVYKRMTQNEYIQEFACIFFDNMSEIMEKHRLSQTEIRILLRLGKYLQFGNRVKIKQKLLSEELGISPSNISAAIKRLKTCEILLDVDGEMYFNPHLFAKGKIDNYLLEVGDSTEVNRAIRRNTQND